MSNAKFFRISFRLRHTFSHFKVNFLGLNHGNFCILNKQYTEAQYRQLLPNIIEKMKIDGDFGEFLPIEFCPFGYNETTADLWYPKKREKVLANGWAWQDELPFMTGQETLREMPDDIADTSDTITEETLACIRCHRNYRIIPQELKFHRMQGYQLPRECFLCRKQRRLQLRNPRKFWDRNCAKCRKPIATSYSPERPERVYCEECYLAAVY